MNRSDPLSCFAPAKLNLFLHIVGRRADGMHLLQTVFQLLDFGDELTFQLTDDGQITRLYDLPGVSAGQDLIVRAAKLLRSYCAENSKTEDIDDVDSMPAIETKGVEINLIKRIPEGGGLGGGSSDAATTLLGLNELWQCGLNTPQLMKLGEQLGADVPVFVNGHSVWAEGIGEQLSPISLPKSWFIVLNPQIHVSTEQLFSSLQLNRDCSDITIRDFLQGQGFNVFEEIVKDKYPEVAKALDALAPFGDARLTGTGACVFVRFDDEASARACWAKLSKDWRGFVAQGLDSSPLQLMLKGLEKD